MDKDQILDGLRALNSRYREYERSEKEVAKLTREIDTLIAKRDEVERSGNEILEELKAKLQSPQDPGARTESAEEPNAPPVSTETRCEHYDDSVWVDIVDAQQTIDTAHPAKLNIRYCHVVRIGGVWSEIRCKHCGATANSGLDNFLSGASGMKNHLRMTHGIRLGGENVLFHCSTRQVSADDVFRLEAKGDPEDVPMVPCNGAGRCKGCSWHEVAERVELKNAGDVVPNATASGIVATGNDIGTTRSIKKKRKRPATTSNEDSLDSSSITVAARRDSAISTSGGVATSTFERNLKSTSAVQEQDPHHVTNGRYLDIPPANQTRASSTATLDLNQGDLDDEPIKSKRAASGQSSNTEDIELELLNGLWPRYKKRHRTVIDEQSA